MRRLCTLSILSLALASLSGLDSKQATAATLFQSFLNSAQEVEPGGATNSPATGSATLELNDAGSELAYSINLPGNIIDFGPLTETTPLTPDDDQDDAMMLHFHNAPRGENGPVVFNIFGLAEGNPVNDDPDDRNVAFNDDSVTISGVWDLEDPGSTSLSQFAPELLAAAPGEDTELYLNLHSVADPAGIIRGQVEAVPEPGSFMGVVLASGVGGLLLRRRLAAVKASKAQD